MRDYVLLYVNGRRHCITGSDVLLSLADFLRQRLRLVGTKVVCSEGDCGACSVLVGRLLEDRLVYHVVDSCIQFLFQIDGCHVVTVEGLAAAGGLGEVQQAMVRCHGSQCGFCTPGFVVAMTALRERAERVEESSLRAALAGNLCRCTGYAPIIQAGLALNQVPHEPLDQRYRSAAMIADLQRHATSAVTVRCGSAERPRILASPSSLAGAIRFLAAHPDAVLVAGGTDVGVAINKQAFEPDVVLDLNRVPALADVRVENRVVRAGARATWTDVRRALRLVAPEFHRVLGVFGAPQIRNVGTIGGNIANASPVADSLPFLYVCGATLQLQGSEGVRQVKIDQFYRGYKQIDLRPGELITEVRIPLPPAAEPLRLTRVSRRRDLDIASFTAAVLLRLDGPTIASAAVAFGAVGPTVIRARQTEAFLAGRPLSEETMRAAGGVAVSEISPLTDVRGSADFRRQLARNALLKFYHDRPEEARYASGG